MGLAIAMGVDVGQKSDPTAIVVAEMRERPTDRTRKNWVEDRRGRKHWADEPETETEYIIRHIERLPLMTSYPDVATIIAARMTRLAELVYDALYADMLQDPPAFLELEPLHRQAAASTWLLIDATGVGQPVIDLVRTELRDRRSPITAVTFRHGDVFDVHLDQQDARLGKAFLVSRLQSLLQTQRIKLPATQEARDLAEELRNYEIRVDQDANDKYGAFRTGTHDDLATALGLATLLDPMAQRVRSVPNPWYANAE